MQNQELKTNSISAIEMYKNTIKYEGTYIFIKPLCDFFNIDYENQLRNINNNQLLKKLALKKTSISIFGDNFERVAVSKRGYITWILQINPKIVQENLRDNFILYQELIFDFMFGSIEREENIKHNYQRLSKLKDLKSKISNEIKKCELNIENYLNGKFMQTQLDFKEYRSIG
jgi:hypothetical protein